MIEETKMGLFSKKKHENKTPSLPPIPELPTLPPLENFPQNDYDDLRELHQLPSFPTNQIGEKFSQNSIKNAISGENQQIIEEEEEILRNPLIAKGINMEPKMQQIAYSGNIEENPKIQNNIPFIKTEPTTKPYKKVNSTEPIFIRIDKFEESLEIFQKTKEKIKEIEELLKKTNELKIKEEKELSLWEIEVQELKKQIETVNKDIFSRIQ